MSDKTQLHTEFEAQGGPDAPANEGLTPEQAAEEIVMNIVGMIERDEDTLRDAAAIIRRVRPPSSGEWREQAGEVAKSLGIARRWLCRYCSTYYAEYVNGCPRCHLGEPGTATSVVCVWAIYDGENWHETDLAPIASALSSAHASGAADAAGLLGECRGALEALIGLTVPDGAIYKNAVNLHARIDAHLEARK